MLQLKEGFLSSVFVDVMVLQTDFIDRGLLLLEVPWRFICCFFCIATWSFAFLSMLSTCGLSSMTNGGEFVFLYPIVAYLNMRSKTK